MGVTRGGGQGGGVGVDGRTDEQAQTNLPLLAGGGVGGAGVSDLFYYESKFNFFFGGGA